MCAILQMCDSATYFLHLPVYSFSAMFWCCLLDDRNGIWSVKITASKSVGILSWGQKYPVGTTSWCLSCENAPDKDDWRLRFKGAAS